MRAAVFYGNHDIRIEEAPIPTVGRDELLLEVLVVGVCGTDAAEFDAGPSMFPIAHRDRQTGHEGPMIPGHEFVGRVEAVGSEVEGFEVDMQVVSSAGVACGRCHWCRRGQTNLCRDYWTVGLERNGALAEYVAVPASVCMDVAPYGLTTDAAALAQPMSIGVHAVGRGRLEAGDVAVLIGTGAIGTFMAHAAAATGATVVAVDLDDRRLFQARQLGAAHIVNPDEVSAAQYLAENALIPTVVYEVTGSTAGLDAALAATARGTRLVLVGHQTHHRTLDLDDLILREVEVIGSNASVFDVDLPRALSVIAAREAGWADIAPVALPLEDLVAGALEPIARGTSAQVKTLIDPRSARSRPTRMI